MTTIEHDVLDDEEITRWVMVGEAIREDPRILGWLQDAHPDTYQWVIAGLRELHRRVRAESWRDPRPGLGGRPEQLFPGSPGSFSDRVDWVLWLLTGGRGSGKSRTGGEATAEMTTNRQWFEPPVWGLVGQTLDAVRTVMFENTLLHIIPEGMVRQWNRGPCELWLHNGAFLKGFSSEAPRKILGYNLAGAWCDEMATWADADRSPRALHTTWSNLVLAVRAHDNRNWVPKIIGTTTPKAVRLLRNPDPDDPENPGPGLYDQPTTVISNMSTMANAANLPVSFMTNVIEPLKGTRLYNQEVLGELVDAALGAQWTHELIDQMTKPEHWPMRQGGGFERIVIGVDPSVGEGLGDECGIVVVGLAADERAYIIADMSLRAPARIWVEVVRSTFERFNANLVVVEKNNGGELVRETMGRYAPNLPIVEVWAKRNKILRAEPVALLSDQDRLRIAAVNDLSKLTYQMTTWEGDGPSPDRLDAMVYAVLHLIPPDNIGELISTFRPRTRQ